MSDAWAIEVRITRNGAVHQRFLCELSELPVIMAGMNAQPVSLEKPVVGPTDLACAVDRWVADMERRGVTTKSIGLFVKRVRACAAYCNWTRPGDMDHEGASAWLGYMRKEGGWGGATHDQAISALRGFSRFLTACRAIPFDPWTALERTGETGEVGGRALTLEEIRSMVAVGYAAASLDRRCRAPRGLFYGTLALTGMRYSEGEACCWGDFDLDGEVPAMYSNPKWDGNKNGKRMRVVLASQLVLRLREWKKCVPCGPNDHVFPAVPNRATFAKDRALAGVPELDGRQRPVGFHSLRRSFATLLYGTGASDAVVTRMMRHAHSVTQQRYIDPPADLEIAAAEGIPPVFHNVEKTEVLNLKRLAPRDQIFSPDSSKTQARETDSRYLGPAKNFDPDNRKSTPVLTEVLGRMSPCGSGSGLSPVGVVQSEASAVVAGRGTPSGEPRDGTSGSGPLMPRGGRPLPDVLILLTQAVNSQARLLEALGRMFEDRASVALHPEPDPCPDRV